MMMVIEFDTDNGAFDDEADGNEAYELEQIFRGLLSAAKDGAGIKGLAGQVIRDSNGNTIGGIRLRR